MIDSMFQAGTDQALNDQLQRPMAPPKVHPSLFAGFGTSVATGLESAGLESGAMFSDVLGAFGQTQAAAGAFGSGGMFSTQTPSERAESEQQRKAMLTQGVDMSSPTGDALRTKARDIMPDPASTGAASQIVGGLLNFAGKAVGYTLTMGPAGPAWLGADVGLTESDRLKQQGVDINTRTKAGAVAGGVAALSVIAPMSGATAVTRFAKGAGVGEASMIGQSMAEKAILNAAGYKQQAATFDPFDPVSLAIGVVPGALGAKFGHAAPKAAPAGALKPLAEMGLPDLQALSYNDVRLDQYTIEAAKKYGVPPEVALAVKNAGEKSGPTAVGPQTKYGQAVGVMQLLADTAADNGVKDRADPLQNIDGGVRYLKKLHDQYGSWDAAIAHYNGGGAAAEAVLRGKLPPAPETQAYMQRVHDYMGKTLDDHAAAAVRIEPDLVDAVRVNQAAEALERSRLTPDDDLAARSAHTDAVEMAADQMGRGEAVDVADKVQPFMIDAAQREANFRAWFGDSKVVDEKGEPLVVYHGTNAQFEVFDPGQLQAEGIHLTTNPSVASRYAASRAMDGGRGANVMPLYVKADRVLDAQMITTDAIKEAAAKGFDAVRRGDHLVAMRPEQIKSAIGNSGRFDPHSASLTDPLPKLADAVRQMHEATRGESPVLDVSARSGEIEPAVGKSAPAINSEASQAAIDRAAAEVHSLNPDMLVQMDGMESPVRVGDLLDRIKEEATADKRDAKLIEVAASCFVRT